MKISKVVGSLVFGILGISQLGFAAQNIACKVSSINPPEADFFRPTLPRNLNPPVVGDQIDIDLSSLAITNLTFKSGNGIALQRNQAQLIRQVSQPNQPGDQVFLGANRSRGGQIYTGSLLVSASQGQDFSHFATLSINNLSALETHQLTLICNPID